MEVLDDEGRLFGVINVVDALVVVLVLAAGIVGGWFLFGGDAAPSTDVPTETRYVTFDAGDQPEYVVEQIREGETHSSGVQNLTVTDVYVSPGQEGVRTLLRVAVTGPVDGDSVLVEGESIRLGRTLTFQGPSYEISGTVTDIGNSSDLSTATTPVLVRTNLTTDVVGAVREGDTYRVAGQRVATVESVTVYGTTDPDRKQAYVGMSVQTVTARSAPLFGPGRRVVEDATLPFRTNAYGFSGRIVRVGDVQQRGTPVNRTVELTIRDVSPDRAGDIEAGMTESARGETVARLVDVEQRPNTTIVESSDGQVFAREHPVRTDLTITAELSVRETETGTLFKGRRIQNGENVTLDLGSTTIRTTVADVDA